LRWVCAIKTRISVLSNESIRDDSPRTGGSGVVGPVRVTWGGQVLIYRFKGFVQADGSAVGTLTYWRAHTDDGHADAGADASKSLMGAPNFAATSASA
jgi:hypothetical protein